MTAYEVKTGTDDETALGSGQVGAGQLGSGQTGTRRGEAGEQAIETVQAAAHHMQQAGRDAMDSMRLVGGNFQRAFEESLRERPAATVGMAAAIGFVLGAIWKR